MYSKDQKCGTSDFSFFFLDAGETWTGTVHFKCVFGHVYKCCFSFFFFFTSTSCIGVTLVDTYCMLFRYSLSHGCRKAFCCCFFPLYLYMSTKMCLLIPAHFFLFFRTESLAFTHIIPQSSNKISDGTTSL